MVSASKARAEHLIRGGRRCLFLWHLWIGELCVCPQLHQVHAKRWPVSSVSFCQVKSSGVQHQTAKCI